jgi:conserved oligomeric Golgi complex subunit 8
MAGDLLQDVLATPSDRHDKDRYVYFAHLASLSASDLETSEPAQLAKSSHSLLMTIQALSKKSHKPIIRSISSHDLLGQSLPGLHSASLKLKAAIPGLDNEALRFSTTYNKTSNHQLLAKRRKDLVLLRNVDRLVDVMELPTLMTTTISSGPVNHSLALDLSGHIRRLATVYEDSSLVATVASQAESAVQQLATELVQSLDVSGLKLAAAMRSMGLLRRVLPDICPASVRGPPARGSQEKTLGIIFLLRRLATLGTTLEALGPLRRLAEGERTQQAGAQGLSSWSGGQHTERYLRRYVEIFREHSFGIISMFKSIFAGPGPGTTTSGRSGGGNGKVDGDDGDDGDECGADPLQPLPTALSTFVLHLTDLLLGTLAEFLPIVKDQSSRDSILTQVLYCAGSLARLSGDFSILLAASTLLGEKEWVDIVKRHRLLTGRLETALGEFKR